MSDPHNPAVDPSEPLKPNKAAVRNQTPDLQNERDSQNERDRWQEQLSESNPSQCVQALRQISSHENVHGLTADVVRLAGSHDDAIRMWAADALESSIRPEPQELLMLIQLLDSCEDSESTYWAATMIGRLGVQAGAAAEALGGCLKRSDYLPARERIVWALSQLGPEASIAVPALKEAIDDGSPRLQQLAQEAIARIQTETTDQDDESVEDAA